MLMHVTLASKNILPESPLEVTQGTLYLNDIFSMINSVSQFGGTDVLDKFQTP